MRLYLFFDFHFNTYILVFDVVLLLPLFLYHIHLLKPEKRHETSGMQTKLQSYEYVEV